MKISPIILATAIVAVAASCSGKVSDVTEITGNVTIDGITEVNVLVQNAVDTLVPVVDGKFSLTLPTDVANVGRVMAGNNAVTFIPDGTPLNIVMDGSDAMGTVTSKYPKISVQEKMNVYLAEEKALVDEYMAKQKEIAGDTLLTDEEKNAKLEEFFGGFFERYNEHHKNAVVANPDNFIAVNAIGNLRGELEDDEMSALINTLSPAVQESRMVSAMKKALDARGKTSEGKMFIDFTVNSVVGMTRSIPPQPKYAEVKFSDYVGKGKYVLVDFWAPWCGPCKREIPNIKKVYDQYKDKGFEVLSIAVWERKPVQVTIDTAAELGMDWLHINNAGSVPTDIYGVEGIPHLMLIGPDGTILKRGFHGLDGITEAISEYIK